MQSIEKEFIINEQNIISGSQAKIISGIRKIDNIPVIIKKYILNDKKDEEAFKKETKTLERFNNFPYIVKMIKYFTENNSGIIILEYLHSDLYEYIINNNSLSLYQIKKYFYQLSLTIKEIHSQNIAHLDLKLENILLDIHNDSIKLCDFGTCVSYKNNQEFIGRRGTPGYCSFEIMNKKAFIPLYSDIWSLGIILHILLTGSLPFKTNNLNNNNLNNDNIYCKDNFSDDYKYNYNLSNTAIDLLSKLLQFNPKKRLSIEEILSHDFLSNIHKTNKINKNKTKQER